MKTSLILNLIVLLISINIIPAQSQNPNDPVWGLYASGVGEKLKPGMDPCWITYTVALSSNPRIQANLSYGTMGALATNVTWFEASAMLRRFGRYFDDQPDGTYKLSPCEVPKPDLSCPWSSSYGNIHWGSGYYGSKTRTISGKLAKEGGKWVYRGTWGRTNGSRTGGVVFTFNGANSFTGFWTEGSSGKQTKWTGSGKCN